MKKVELYIRVIISNMPINNPSCEKFDQMLITRFYHRHKIAHHRQLLFFFFIFATLVSKTSATDLFSQSSSTRGIGPFSGNSWSAEPSIGIYGARMSKSCNRTEWHYRIPGLNQKIIISVHNVHLPCKRSHKTWYIFLYLYCISLLT